MRNWHDEICVFDYVFVGQINSLYLLFLLLLVIFKKSIFRKELTQLCKTLSCHLHFCMSHFNHAVLCRNNSVLKKIRNSLHCGTSHCIKANSKLILPSGKVKQICIKCESIKVSHKMIQHPLTVLKLIEIMIEQCCFL